MTRGAVQTVAKTRKTGLTPAHPAPRLCASVGGRRCALSEILARFDDKLAVGCVDHDLLPLGIDREYLALQLPDLKLVTLGEEVHFARRADANPNLQARAGLGNTRHVRMLVVASAHLNILRRPPVIWLRFLSRRGLGDKHVSIREAAKILSFARKR